MKKILFWILIIVLLLGVVYVLLCCNDNVFWNKVDEHEGIEVEDEDNSDIDTNETLLYQDKYIYAVGYLKELLGNNVDLTTNIVVVDISEQSEYIFSKEGNFNTKFRISTAEDGTGREMSKSLWRVVSKTDSGLTPLYGPRLMMMDRFFGGDWITTQVALHGTEEPERIGTKFGLGCVYHNNADIITLFDILEIGDYVVVID